MSVARPLSPLAALETALATLVGPSSRPGGVGLAVSGGGDSIAMLQLFGPRLRDLGIPVAVATVDHGLRPEAADEAAFVARVCRGLTLPHDILIWTDRDGPGNLSARAREARIGLLGQWARDRGFPIVALGHTMDDQAETVLMRLARGAGVDGLRGMDWTRRRDGLDWIRPFLMTRRDALREYLKAAGQDWVEDPTNADDRFERVRIRRALAVLSELGIGAEELFSVASRMKPARDALELAVRRAGELFGESSGALVIPQKDLASLPEEVAIRLLSRAIRWASGSGKRPAHEAVWQVWQDLIWNKSRTLGGVVLSSGIKRVVIAREFRPVADVEAPTTAIWDNRWAFDGPHEDGLTIRALGAVGLSLCPDWRSAGLPFHAMQGMPAVWRGTELVAAPLAGKQGGWSARVVADFASFLKSD